MLKSMPKRPTFPQQEMADRLLQALEDSGVTQAELARECGVTDQAVHGWITNGRIGKQHFAAICRRTGKTLEYFFNALKTWRRAAALVLCPLILQAVAPDARAFDITFFAPSIQHRYTLCSLVKLFLRLVRLRTVFLRIPLHVFEP